MSLTSKDLRRFLQDELDIETDIISDDSPLFSAGLIDSFSLVTLLVHLEKTCGVTIGATDVNLDNFDSIARILAYVSRMTGERS